MGKWLEMLKTEFSHDDKGQHLAESLNNGREDNNSVVIPLKTSTPAAVSEEAIKITMERACSGLKILPSEFRSMIEDDEAEWIASGRIPMKTARAYVRLFANEVSRDPLHPVNCNMITCWSCDNYRGKQCKSGRSGHEDLWHRCDDYQEVQKMSHAIKQQNMKRDQA